MRKSAYLSSRDQKFISHDSINVTGEPGDTPLQFGDRCNFVGKALINPRTL